MELTKSEQRIARQVERVLAALAEGKKQYARADELMKNLPAAVLRGKRVRLNAGGKTAAVVDQSVELSKKGILWKPCGFRRFDLVVKDA